MQSYPLDLDPEQLTRWIMTECMARPPRFKLAANCGDDISEIPLQERLSLLIASIIRRRHGSSSGGTLQARGART
ncbi:hypothetical protein [Methylocystis hirsuta]|uniref:Uncharacterized protein n=1 Tax=Methylocystis hirsuta TaxID=369798 RepID=A0A3M9XQ25_9HYPH|nr:hypothetical protein [Methylocystis hirsuta]RNJ50134.1 hypothetical protein D1O30_11545 [Methylocystis hirsuta]